MRHAATGTVDVYPVGLLHDLHLMHCGAWTIRRTLYELRYPIRQARAGHWQACRNYFNGYLAEPSVWPDGLARCGSGWTRHRALRSLQRHLAAATIGR